MGYEHFIQKPEQQRLVNCEYLRSMNESPGHLNQVIAIKKYLLVPDFEDLSTICQVFENKFIAMLSHFRAQFYFSSAHIILENLLLHQSKISHKNIWMAFSKKRYHQNAKKNRYFVCVSKAKNK